MAHIANSTALFQMMSNCRPEIALDAVRTGSALVGRVSGTIPEETGLCPVGTLVTTVCEVRSLPKGSTVGYGGEWRLRRDSRIAILSAGTQAGIPRISLKNKLLKRFNPLRVESCIDRVYQV